MSTFIRLACRSDRHDKKNSRMISCWHLRVHFLSLGLRFHAKFGFGPRLTWPHNFRRSRLRICNTRLNSIFLSIQLYLNFQVPQTHDSNSFWDFPRFFVDWPILKQLGPILEQLGLILQQLGPILEQTGLATGRRHWASLQPRWH